MIRPAGVGDLPAILAIYGPYVTHTTCSFEYTVPTPAEFLARFQAITAQFPWLVWEEMGEVLGYAYGSAPFERAAYRWCAEVSIYLRPDARGRGIGRKLYAVLEELLRLQGYRTIYSIITEENQASLDFHRALGYKFMCRMADCGFKFGRWIGVIWLEKPLFSGKIPSNSPSPWPALVKNDRIFHEILANLSLS